MKFATLFGIMSLLVGVVAYRTGGLFLILFWPSANFFSLAIAYWTRQSAVFGKQANGRWNAFGKVYLFPYLVLVRLTWSLLRWASRESPCDELSEELAIGRRLLPFELPAKIKNIVDLTCEFERCCYDRDGLHYVSFPILDGSTTTVANLLAVCRVIDELKGVTYIHCAQGHGRTGLVAASYLMFKDHGLSAGNALRRLQEIRPKLKCNREQMATLQELEAVLT